MTNTTKTARVQRAARLRWVPLGSIKVPPHAQREMRTSFVDQLAANMDLEHIGTPTVSARGGDFYVLDGQHRVAALKQWGLDDAQMIQCFAYDDLDEAAEAEVFLKLNNVLAVDSISKYRIAVAAGRAVECDIDRVVRSQGMCVSRDKRDGAIGAVGTLRRIYARSGAGDLSRTLRVIGEAYGDPGLEASIIDGVALVLARYGEQVDDARLIQNLGDARGGVASVANRATLLRKQTGQSVGTCTAAAVVEHYNRGRGKKLAEWWRA